MTIPDAIVTINSYQHQVVELPSPAAMTAPTSSALVMQCFSRIRNSLDCFHQITIHDEVVSSRGGM